MKDYYYILGAKPEASGDEIKKAYRKLSTKFHPDKNDGDEFFSERFKEIQEAWETLGDEDKRTEYDTNRFGGPKRTDNLIPKINYFTANKNTYDLDEEITFSWVTSNADKIAISPFGKVTANGTKTYRIKTINSNTLHFELAAENSNSNKKITSGITLSRKTANTDADTTKTPKPSNIDSFSLYEYIQDNKEDIDKVLGKIALVCSIIYTLKLTFPLIKECFSNSVYEPITIKSLLYQMGSDWALFADWVYNPSTFVAINSIVGWIFKVLFFIPSPILIAYLMAIGFFYWLKAIVWIAKYLGKFLGTTAGIIVTFCLIIWIVSWFF